MAKDCDQIQNDIEGVKEYFNTKIENVITLIAGNDKNYNTQFFNAKEAVSAALAAQQKATEAAFLAAEKAITKAEDAQKDYNVRSNEFRGQLDDQAKTLMPRPETLGIFGNIDEKITFTQQGFEAKMEAQKLNNEKLFDAMSKEVASLRESRAMLEGKASSASVWISYVISIVGILLGVYGALK